MSTRISNHIAESAKARERRYVVWDSDLAGFGLRVSPSGARTWIARYRVGGGRSAPQRLMSIGSFPKIGAPAARAEAAKILAAAALGRDPGTDRMAKRREMNVSDLVELYEAEGCFVQRGLRQGEPMKANTKAYTLARLRHHVIPLLGKKKVSELVESDVERFARDVAQGRTAKELSLGPRKRVIVRGGEGAARKVVRDLSAVLSFAQRRRIIQFNPVATASVRKTDNRRERFLTLQEVQVLGDALDKLEAAGTNPKAINITRLWALTGARRNEIAGLLWAEVDFDRGLLVLGNSKTGRSIRPLGGAALALLVELRRAAIDQDSALVFPAERGSRFYQGAKQVWPKLTKLAGLPGVTPHTLRHTLGSAAASGGEALLMVGSMLGHSNARSTAIYAHIQFDPARSAADRATGPIADALGLARSI